MFWGANSGPHICVTRTSSTPSTLLLFALAKVALSLWCPQENHSPRTYCPSDRQLLSSCLNAFVTSVPQLWLRCVSWTLPCSDLALCGPTRNVWSSSHRLSKSFSSTAFFLLTLWKVWQKKVTHLLWFHTSLKSCFGFGFSILCLSANWVMFFYFQLTPFAPVLPFLWPRSFSVFLSFGYFSALKFPLVLLHSSIYVLALKSCSQLQLWTFFWHPHLILTSASSYHWPHCWSCPVSLEYHVLCMLRNFGLCCRNFAY